MDLAEFYENPVRTGIQRTVCELLANWPSDIPVQFARYDPHVEGFISISDQAVRFLVHMFGNNTLSPEEIASELPLIDAGIHSQRIFPRRDDKVLVPELFYRMDRVCFYRQAIRTNAFQTFLLIYDFVPWFKPELYRIGPNMRLFMPFLQLAIDVHHRAYISGAVRDDFEHRIMHGHSDGAGRAITLGADGIGLERQTFNINRRNFVCLGTFEAKKCPEIVFEAFRTLARDTKGGKLQFLGKVPEDLPRHLKPYIADKGLDIEIIDGPSDEQLRAYLREARASIFISPNEGFGLPALETLFCGFPTVLHADLPSIFGLPDCGQIRLPDVTVSTVAEAFTQLRDDHFAEALWRDAADLVLPTWREFAAALANWVGEAKAVI